MGHNYLNLELNMNKEKLNRLANQINDGNLLAYKQIFEYLYYDLCMHTNLYVNDFEETRDLIQEVFTKIWEQQGTLPIFKDFKSYIYKISKNKAINFINSKNIRINYNTKNFENDISVVDGIECVEYRELSLIIDNCLENLPETTKLIFKLNKSELKKQSEIAQLLDISIKTVEWHIASAKKKIKNEIKKFYNS
jgi:RNA polymerase sigma-70 factor (ECF subfamily)